MLITFTQCHSLSVSTLGTSHDRVVYTTTFYLYPMEVSASAMINMSGGHVPDIPSKNSQHPTSSDAKT